MPVITTWTTTIRRRRTTIVGTLRSPIFLPLRIPREVTLIIFRLLHSYLRIDFNEKELDLMRLKKEGTKIQRMACPSTISASPIPPPHFQYSILKALPLLTTSYGSFRAAPKTRTCSPRALKPSAAGSVDTQLEFVVEPATNTKFPESLLVPGSEDLLLTLIGTGYREKVFAIIGVKVYAAGLYVHPLILDDLKTVKPEVNPQDRDVGSIFNLVYKAPREKAIKIVLVRDVDGKTFWDALNDAVSPRMISPSKEDELALSKFRETFQGRPLYKGSTILLTWINPSKIIVSVSPDNIPSSVDATIDSGNVASSLYHVYFGSDPVSPSLKLSAESGLARYGLIIS